MKTVTSILSVRIRHQVVFAPNPQNPAFGTRPVFVETRNVADLTNVPDVANKIFFHDVVETTVLVGSDTKTFVSERLNESFYCFARNELDAAKLEANSWSPVDVSPELAEKKIYIFELAGQKHARAA